MKLLRLLGNFWETHNWIYIFFERFWTYRSDDSDEGVCPKMGAVSTNLSGQNALNPWKFCYPTFGQACAYLGASKICAFSLLIYMQAKHVVAYLLDHGEGGPHIFSLLLRQHWRAMASATKSAIVEALRAIAEEAEAKRRFSMMCFPSFLEWCQPQIIPD